MKILSIKALNINSLKGKTEINFSDLTKDSALFAITGPTGSGKSTILDIISCALYGRTARLKNPNDLMSRHCGEAYCEVEFEIRDKKYRSSWSQKRARNKHDGKFQTAKMELIDLADLKPLPLKSKEVSKKIEELSGLDFGRFTQSMMLTQGGFDAFLKADEKERSSLLEKITGTQIYANISIAIFDRHRNFVQDMESDQKVLESIDLLDDELVKQKQKELEQNMTLKKKSDDELKELTLALNWMQRLSELTLESKRYEQEFIEVKKVKEENKSSFEKLALANRALNVSSTFSTHEQLQKSVKADKETSTKFSKELETLNEEIKEKSEAYTLVKKEFEKESAEFEAQNQKLKAAREIETQEKRILQNITKAKISLEAKKETLTGTTKALATIVENYNQINRQTETKNAYLLNNFKDEKLLSTIGIIEQHIKQYKEEDENASSTQNTLAGLSVNLQEEQTKHTVFQKEVDKLSLIFTDKELKYKTLEENSSNNLKTEESFQKSLEETQALLRTLQSHSLLTKKIASEIQESETNTIQEKSFLETQTVSQQHISEIKKHIETLRDKKEQEQQLKNYEEDRKNLVEGEACSLCGSTDHPYVDSLADIHIDETEAKIKSQLKELEEKEKSLRDLEARLVTTQTKIENSKLELQKLNEELETLLGVFKQSSFELTNDSEVDLKEKQEELTKELQELKQDRSKKDELLKERDKARETLQGQEKLLNELNTSLQKHLSEQEQLSLVLKSSQEKIETSIKSLRSHYKEFSVELDIKILDSQYQELFKRKELYTQTQKSLKVLESELNSCKVSKKESETKEGSITQEIKIFVKSLKEFEESTIKLSSKRIEILNVADLDTHEKEINSKYKTVQEKENLLQIELNALVTKNEERSSHKKDLDFKIADEEKKLKKLTFTLEERYKKNDFKDEQELKNASLSSTEREVLSTLCKGIEDKFIQTQTLKSQTLKQLEIHQKEPLTTKPIEELEITQSLLQQKVDELSQSIGSDKKELELNQENSDKFKERITSLEKKKEAFKVWVKLNELIGSADGTKFKKFAQGITLDQLINLANQHLTILSSRYTLARNQDKLLDLEVVDAFQGNVIRSVSTLSGGESFIVSLALALGLSELASQKIAIDSLFLDEGFGTLDEESLETALNALNLLQSSGKMVGVISHVEALKERIPLQIKVVPNGDGTSFVEI